MSRLSAFRARLTVLATAFLLLAAPAAGDPTDLDPSFGSGGVTRLSPNLGLVDAASYADGRIALLVGNRTAPYARSVVRVDTAGRIDASFSVVEALPGFSIDAIAVTGDSRLVALQSYRVMPDGETRITRHLEDGSLDPAFGVSGNALVSRYLYSLHAHLGESGEFSSGLAVEPSGRTYTARHCWCSASSRPGLRGWGRRETRWRS